MTENFTTAEAAEYIGLTEAGIRKQIYVTKQIAPLLKRVQGRLRFSKEELDHYQANRRKQGRPRKVKSP